MTTQSVQRSDSPALEPAEPIRMTREEMETAVSSINAEEIEAIAKTVLAQVMDLMGIDAPKTRFTGRVMVDDQKGDVIGHEVVTEPHRETEARKQFARLGLPLVEKQLADAFSTPGTFLDQGTRLSFIGGGNALVAQMKNQASGAFASTLEGGSLRLLMAMTNLFQRECIGYGITIKVNPEITAKYGELNFDVTDAMGHRGHTLKSFREEAAK